MTRDQKYAAKAYEQVSGDVPQGMQSEYRSMAEKLPVLIRTAGLTQALHFAYTRGDAATKLLAHLADAMGRKTLLADSRSAEFGEYMRLTQEALTALHWYKRFAQALLKGEPKPAGSVNIVPEGQHV